MEGIPRLNKGRKTRPASTWVSARLRVFLLSLPRASDAERLLASDFRRSFLPIPHGAYVNSMIE